MKLAILSRKGSFSDGWIDYCQRQEIPFVELSPYDSDIMEKIADCDAVLWHHHHANEKDRLFAKQLLYSIEQSGKQVFPDFKTGWHFDDKLGQKYLLEGIEAPLVPSYAFYDKKTALEWANSTTFPKVFKLRGGAGSSNVMLVRSKIEAVKLIKRCFGKGFKELEYWKTLKYQWEKYRSGLISFKNLLNISIATARQYIKSVNNREHGYAYFQEFMPENKFDFRIVVIANQYALGEKRYTRDCDFRASGSGKFDYSDIDVKAIELAFRTAKSLQLQSVAFDIIYAPDKTLKIIEMCYGFGTHGISQSPGYWTSDLMWHGRKGFDFCGWMVEDIIEKIKNEPKDCPFLG